MNDPEEIDKLLDPHREEARRIADREVTAKLRNRGIRLSDGEDSGDLADLMTAVERFESMVEAEGGDLMVNDLRSSAPEDLRFVLPQREAGEPLRRYIARVEQAALALRKPIAHSE
jgi:hypothetical protein